MGLQGQEQMVHLMPDVQDDSEGEIMLCQFCGHHLAKCHDGNLRAKHYSHQTRCKARKAFMENRGVLRFLKE